MLGIDSQRVTEQLTKFIKDAFKRANFFRAVIALSGGVDSATSCALAVRALGAGSVYPVLLPYGTFNPQGMRDAETIIKALGVARENVIRIDIKPMVDPLIRLDSSIDNIRKGNIMARVRMTALFDQAKKQKALVVGTENKSERLLGYFTRFGDSASDIEPLANLYKTQVFKLAKYLGIPESIITKPPTAGLWKGQTDEGD
ncbi:NAD(+) synthase, partial [Candidatus Gottesmanbacteria bacterium]|nr:NAD(+) synthase [Candidatus Gottesmanbacteria bacterium]